VPPISANRRDIVALRRVVAADRSARHAARDLNRWMAGHDEPTRAALFCAGELIRRALARRAHVDYALVERLQLAVNRIDLLAEADRMRVHPDVLAEIRMLASEIALQLLRAA